MLHSRRAVLAAGAAGMTTLAAAKNGKPTPRPGQDIVSELVRNSELGNAALLRGDVETYHKFIKLADDFTLMSPFGGTPSQGKYSDEQWQEIARFFRNGTLRQELVEAYSSSDMVALVLIEHCRGEVGGLPLQDWSLRVTLVYRREADDWLLVHRHADPLANGITVEQSAVLARGAKSS
jgi:ketosteroid isomerase-like protein